MPTKKINKTEEILDKIFQNFELEVSKKLYEAIILLKPKDINKWSQLLYQSISQYDLRQSLVTKRRQLASKFSWSEAAQKTIEVFEKTLR